MIVRMKHLDLVCVSADRDATLERLRALGVVHLDFSGVAGADVAAAKGAAARRAVAKAMERLYPPVGPSTSRTSPAKYRFLIFLLSIVEGLISFVLMPPWVIMASL